MLFGEGLETAGKPVVEDNTLEPVDLRTKPAPGEGENTDDAEAAATLALEEKETRKQEFLATGKTEADFDAEEARLEAEKNKTPEQIAEEQRIAAEAATKQQEQAAEQQRIETEMRQKFLKELGVNSEEELKAKLTPTKPKTPEELAQEQEIYNVSLAKFAIDNKVFNNDEWLAVQNMRKAPDNDLVFNNFAAEYKEANKGRTQDDKPFPVTNEEIQDKFNELYHVDSENAALKAEGEKNLALKAKAIRDPLETKFNDIQQIYNEEIAQKQAVPDFRKFMQGILATAIPDKLEFGTGDDKVVFDLSKLDKEAFQQSLFDTGLMQKEFQDFFKGKGAPEQRARIEREVKKELLFMYNEDIAKETFKAGISKGTKVTAPGSKAPFVDPAKKEVQAQKVTITDADKAKVANAFAGI